MSTYREETQKVFVTEGSGNLDDIEDNDVMIVEEDPLIICSGILLVGVVILLEKRKWFLLVGPIRGGGELNPHGPLRRKKNIVFR